MISLKNLAKMRSHLEEKYQSGKYHACMGELSALVSVIGNEIDLQNETMSVSEGLRLREIKESKVKLMMSDKEQCKECGGRLRGRGVACDSCKKRICLSCFDNHAFFERCFIYESAEARKAKGES